MATPHLRRLVDAVLVAGTVGLLILVILAHTAALWQPGELAVHWSLHAGLALLVPTIVWRRRRGWNVACALGFVLGLLPWGLAAWQPRAPRTGAGVPLRVVAANLYVHSKRQADAVAEIVAQRPAVIAIEEMAPQVPSLPALAAWPHRIRGGNHYMDVALFSRYPLLWSTLHPGEGKPIIEAVLDCDGRRLRVLAVHTYSPENGWRSAARDRQLATIAGLAAASPEPVLVLGDLNLTAAHPVFSALLREGRLCRAEAPRQATWPSPLGPLGIAIDHVLAGPGVALTEQRILPLSGSDHRGLVVDALIP